MVQLRTRFLLAGLGVVPLLIIWLFPVLKMIVGWGIGTYPLIVIAFIAGTQYQIASAAWLQTVCLLYPVGVSIGMMLYGGAFEFYSLGLIMGLIVDLLLLYKHKVDVKHVMWRITLVLPIIILLYIIGGSSF